MNYGNAMIRIASIRFVIPFFFSLIFLFGQKTDGQSLQSTSQTGKHLMFENAEGFGIYSPAGRGGKIIKVTNLNGDGPGSFREALESKGPRIVVFEVAGVIDLNKVPLKINEPFLTVAGQTAPSPGITIIKEGIQIFSHDILIQHIRFRPGDAGEPKKSGFEPDCSTSGPDAFNIVIDHCSFSWAVDENISVSGPRYNGPEGTSRNVTISNCIVAEGLCYATHLKGLHSMGTLVHDNCTNVAVIKNLYSQNNQRNPFFKAFATGVIVNNVVFNPGKFGIEVDYVKKEWNDTGITPQNARVSVVGNWTQHGINSRKELAILGPLGDAYMEDNVGWDVSGNILPQTYGEVKILNEKPSWPDKIKVLPSDKIVDYVLKNAGARPKDRDEVDNRIIDDFRNRKSRFIDSQEDVGGYPKSNMVIRKLNVPETNIDEWLSQFSKMVE